ncbi:DUF5372 family protein [Methylobacter sp.]|uniref:DUF5372 family protein n=1 Tax=Methylobacter sp. TaxID=2051955 RepID=UPI00344FE9F8
MDVVTPESKTFEITHPFHPRRGMRFILTTRRQNWGEDRVMFYDAEGRLCSMLASWTDVPEQDLFAQASAGRSWFRTDDLLRLSSIMDEIVGGLSVK